MKSPNDASKSQEQETLDRFDEFSDDSRNPVEEMQILSQILGGQVPIFGNWLDNPIRQERMGIAVEGNGNGNEMRIVVNEEDHVDRDWPDWELVSPCSSVSEFEVIGHDGESVEQEPCRGGRVKDGGAGDGSEKEEAITSKNEVQVLSTVPPSDVSLEPNRQMLPVGDVEAISNNQVIIRVTYADIPPLSRGTEIWVTGSSLLLGVIDRISAPVESHHYFVRCNIDGDVGSQIRPGTSVSIVRGLADRDQSNKDESISHGDNLSDDRKEAACKQMAKRKNDQRQRNSAGNRQGPSDRDVNTRGTSSGSQAPSQEDTSRENVGASRANACPSQPRQTQGCKPPAPSTSVNPSNRFNLKAIRQVPSGILGPPVVALPPGVAPCVSFTPAFQSLHLNAYTSNRHQMKQNPVWPLPVAMPVPQQFDPPQGLHPVPAHAAPQRQMNVHQVPNYSPHGISYQQDFPLLPASGVGSNEPLAGQSDALSMQSTRASCQNNQVLCRGKRGHTGGRRDRHQQ